MNKLIATALNAREAFDSAARYQELFFKGALGAQFSEYQFALEQLQTQPADWSGRASAEERARATRPDAAFLAAYAAAEVATGDAWTAWRSAHAELDAARDPDVRREAYSLSLIRAERD